MDALCQHVELPSCPIPGHSGQQVKYACVKLGCASDAKLLCAKCQEQHAHHDQNQIVQIQKLIAAVGATLFLDEKHPLIQEQSQMILPALSSFLTIELICKQQIQALNQLHQKLQPGRIDLIDNFYKLFLKERADKAGILQQIMAEAGRAGSESNQSPIFASSLIQTELESQHQIFEKIDNQIKMAQNQVQKFQSDLTAQQGQGINYKQEMQKQMQARAPKVFQLDMDCINSITQLKCSKQMQKLTDTDVKNLMDQYAVLTNVKKLDLNLPRNEITEVGGNYVIESIKKLSALSILKIDLSENKFQQDRLAALVEGIQELKQLKRLSLKFCSFSSISKNGARLFSEKLNKIKSLSKLSLKLGKNYLGGDVVFYICKEIAQMDSLLELSLDLSYNEIKENILAIGQQLSSKKKLKVLRLNVRKNDILEEDAIKFTGTITQLPNLEELRLDLSENTLTQKGCGTLIATLKKMGNLAKLILNLEDTKVENPKGVQELFRNAFVSTNFEIKI